MRASALRGTTAVHYYSHRVTDRVAVVIQVVRCWPGRAEGVRMRHGRSNPWRKAFQSSHCWGKKTDWVWSGVKNCHLEFHCRHEQTSCSTSQSIHVSRKCEVKLAIMVKVWAIGCLFCLKILPSSDVMNSDTARGRPGKRHLSKQSKLFPL